MNIDNVEINTQSSIKIIFDKIIYFDPYMIKENKKDADIIFITHEHYDHMDIKSIEKIKNDNTIVIAPKSMKEVVKNISFKEYVFLNSNEETNIKGLNIKTVPAYNINKPFHPKKK